jgi:hypothetical protein
MQRTHGAQQIAPRFRRTLLRFFVLLLLAVSCSADQQDSRNREQPSEYQVKAAFLLNFTKFVEWPATEPTDSHTPFAICIFGEDPFGKALDEVIEGETLNDRKVIVRRIDAEPLGSCQVLFLSKSVTQVPHILATVGSGVLTVGEGEGFIHEGGIIAFVIENRRVRFDINQRAAQHAGLTLSSRLLSVARSVAK